MDNITAADLKCVVFCDFRDNPDRVVLSQEASDVIQLATVFIPGENKFFYSSKSTSADIHIYSVILSKAG